MSSPGSGRSQVAIPSRPQRRQKSSNLRKFAHRISARIRPRPIGLCFTLLRPREGKLRPLGIGKRVPVIAQVIARGKKLGVRDSSTGDTLRPLRHVAHKLQHLGHPPDLFRRQPERSHPLNLRLGDRGGCWKQPTVRNRSIVPNATALTRRQSRSNALLQSGLGDRVQIAPSRPSTASGSR